MLFSRVSSAALRRRRETNRRHMPYLTGRARRRLLNHFPDIIDEAAFFQRRGWQSGIRDGKTRSDGESG